MISRTLLIALAAVSIVPLHSARAQETSPSPSSSRTCSPNHYEDGLATYAESRDQRLPAASSNQIDPGQNGSVLVHGWQQSDVLVRACIQSAAPSDSEAHRHRWDASYEVWVPTASNVDARAHNGSIGIEAIHGNIRFDTTNGSVRLDKLAGDVAGSTTNGSVRITLDGNRWDGAGLRAETTNGSVRVSIPDNYSAKVEASTVNGRVHVDFPITVSGELGRSLSFQLGSGGPTVEAHTTNGSIQIGRT